jgi:uncharacterized protein (DUF1684 family)
MVRLSFLALALAPAALAMSYTDEILAWRAARESSLKADGGWLTLAGLFWLKEGANSFGTASGNDIVLPDGPERAGTFHLHGEKVTVALGSSAARELRPDNEAAGDIIRIKELTLYPIKRGDRYGIRLKDKNSSFRREFTGLHWFPVKEAARVTAKFVAAPGKVTIPNILGQKDEEDSPGYAVFQWEGRELRLQPVLEDGRLFFIFRDMTSGKETYGAGRFLYADAPKDGTVVLDFNKAYTPPCAFTPYATCPLPPPQNRMAVRMEAGELKYGSH